MEKYERLAYLESGSTGEVWLVENKETKERFAVKFIKRGRWIDKNVVREIKIHKLLRHRNIIQFKEVVLTPIYLGIVMEYAEGGDLHDKVSNTSKKRLNESQARYFFQQLTSGIWYCHSVNVCHRDVKPGNVLLDGSNPQQLKICDFGYSKSSQLHSKPKSVVGTPECMAPEVCLGEGAYDGKLADVWSLGVTLYYMLVGRYPHDKPDEHPQDPMITGGKNACPYYIPSFLSLRSRKLLARMLVQNPKERITIEKIMENRWYKKNLAENLAEKTQVMEEYPSFSLQRDEEIMNIVEEAQSLDANGIKEEDESWEEEESRDEEDVESGKEEEDEN